VVVAFIGLLAAVGFGWAEIVDLHNTVTK